MRNITEQEYFELCERLADQYYDDIEPEVLPEESWIPSESEATLKLKKMLPGRDGVIDLTDASKSQVFNRLHDNSNFKIGNFLLRIIKYKGEPLEGITLDIVIYEERKKISVKIDPTKDDRFQTRSWANYFKSVLKTGKDIPINVLPDIVKWLQVAQKLKAFL